MENILGPRVFDYGVMDPKRGLRAILLIYKRFGVMIELLRMANLLAFRYREAKGFKDH